MSSYDASHAELVRLLPQLATVLRRAQEHRTRTAASLLHGARFKGLDQLLRYLDDLLHACQDAPTLVRVAFLIDRSRADLETAIEATLSGYVAVAVDAMRDVMEIENLLLDFAISPHHIEEWLHANQRALRTKFSPATIRQRLHAAGEGRYETTAESLDYHAHSAALHVSPHRHPIAAKGYSAEQGWGGDAGFWEIFEHMRRLQIAVRRLTSALEPGSAVDQLAGQELSDVQDAWRRTQEMQAMYFALLKAAAERRAADG